MDAIYHRRAVRNYIPRTIARAVIRKLLDAAVHAPTAMHEEPWSFAVIQDKALLSRLSDSAKERVRSEAQGSDSHTQSIRLSWWTHRISMFFITPAR